MDMNRKRVAEAIEDLRERVAFIMEIAQAKVAVGSRLDPKGPQIIEVSFKDLYRELKHAGGEIRKVTPNDMATGREGELVSAAPRPAGAPDNATESLPEPTATEGSGGGEPALG